MKYSIITALYNNLDDTKIYIQSLINTLPEGEFEIILVDDGSTDGTREFLSSLKEPFYKIHLNDENKGFAYSNNKGASLARGDTLVLLNNDLKLAPGWLEPMLAIIQQEKDVGFVGNIQLQPATDKVNHAGVWFDLLGRPCHYTNKLNTLQATPYACWKAVTAACVIVKKDVFMAFNGFDEGYCNGFEDIDLCLKMNNAGKRHFVSHRSIIQHHLSASPGRKNQELQNWHLFDNAWGAYTRERGAIDWPKHYLQQYARCPWRYNINKLIDALLRLAGLKTGTSAWAQIKLNKLRQDAQNIMG